jgi:hypothetical protein
VPRRLEKQHLNLNTRTDTHQQDLQQGAMGRENQNGGEGQAVE